MRGLKACTRMEECNKGNVHQRAMPPLPADVLASGLPRLRPFCFPPKARSDKNIFGAIVGDCLKKCLQPCLRYLNML